MVIFFLLAYLKAFFLSNRQTCMSDILLEELQTSPRKCHPGHTDKMLWGWKLGYTMLTLYLLPILALLCCLSLGCWLLVSWGIITCVASYLLSLSSITTSCCWLTCLKLQTYYNLTHNSPLDLYITQLPQD